MKIADTLRKNKATFTLTLICFCRRRLGDEAWPHSRVRWGIGQWHVWFCLAVAPAARKTPSYKCQGVACHTLLWICEQSGSTWWECPCSCPGSTLLINITHTYSSSYTKLGQKWGKKFIFRNCRIANWFEKQRNFGKLIGLKNDVPERM